jgi:hypothetical protein
MSEFFGCDDVLVVSCFFCGNSLLHAVCIIYVWHSSIVRDRTTMNKFINMTSPAVCMYCTVQYVIILYGRIDL